MVDGLVGYVHRSRARYQQLVDRRAESRAEIIVFGVRGGGSVAPRRECGGSARVEGVQYE